MTFESLFRVKIHLGTVGIHDSLNQTSVLKPVFLCCVCPESSGHTCICLCERESTLKSAGKSPAAVEE